MMASAYPHPYIPSSQQIRPDSSLNPSPAAPQPTLTSYPCQKHGLPIHPLSPDDTGSSSTLEPGQLTPSSRSRSSLGSSEDFCLEKMFAPEASSLNHPPRTPRLRQFQNSKSPAAEEWERQKREEGAENEIIDQIMALVGLEKVKRQVLAIKDKVEICKKQETDLKKERFNIIFQGNPGTGKALFTFVSFIHPLTVWGAYAYKRENDRRPSLPKVSPLSWRLGV